MAARTLALAAGGRARAAAAAALGARLQPLAPPLERGFPCPASLLHPRAPPLLGPRGPGAARLRPLAPSSFHPLAAFSSTGTGTAKGVEDQDHPGQGGDGGEERKEAARAIDAGANPEKHAAGAVANGSKNGTKKPAAAAGTVADGSKNGTKKPAAAAGLVKKPRPGDRSTTGDLSKDLQPGGDSEDAKNSVPGADVSQGDNNGTASEGSANPATADIEPVNYSDNPTTELAKKARAGDGSTAGDLSLAPADETSTHSGELLPPEDLPKFPADESSSTHSGELLHPEDLPKSPADESSSTHSGEQLPPEDLPKSLADESSSTHSGEQLPSGGPSREEDLTGIPADVLKVIQALLKENQESILNGVKEMIIYYSNAAEKERNRIGRINQNLFILTGVFVELAIAVAAGFILGIQFGVEMARDKLHSLSGDEKTKETVGNVLLRSATSVTR